LNALAGLRSKGVCIHCDKKFEYDWKGRHRFVCKECYTFPKQQHYDFFKFYSYIQRKFQDPIYQAKMWDLNE